MIAAHSSGVVPAAEGLSTVGTGQLRKPRATYARMNTTSESPPVA
jgi:hypothetical protein